jgi:hypothetical protein
VSEPDYNWRPAAAAGPSLGSSRRSRSRWRRSPAGSVIAFVVALIASLVQG